MAKNVELEKALLLFPAMFQKLEKFLTPAPAPSPVVLKDAKTSDGKVLSYNGDTPQAGQDVMLDGQPAPDGDYQLEDGSVVSVKGSKIVDVKAGTPAPVAQAAAPVTTQPTVTATPTPNPSKVTKYTETVFDANFKTITEQFTALSKENADLKTAFTEQNGIMKDLLTIVQKIAEEPAVPSSFKKKDGAPVKTLSRMDELMESAKTLSKKAFN